MSKTEIVSSRPIFSARWFEVDELDVTYPSGTIHIHHRVVRSPTVHIIPVTEKGEIYLVSQYRYALGKESLETVAGYMDPGESPLQSAKRELKEEAGIEAAQWEGLPIIELGASAIVSKIYIYLATDLVFGEHQREEAEAGMNLVKMTIKEAVGKVMNGEINTSASVIAILMLDRFFREKFLRG